MQKQTGYPSIDKPWMQFFETGVQTVPKCTVWRNIYDHNKDYPNEIALTYYGRKISFADMFRRIETAKRAFISAGVKRGDNVSFLVLSCPEMVYAILALNQLGATANMVNPTFTAEQMRDRINDSEARIIVILDQLYERLASVIDSIFPQKQIIIKLESSMPLTVRVAAHFKLAKKIPYGERVISWESFMESSDSHTPNVPDHYEKDTPAVMVYSSGTTGASKGIVLTNDGINHTLTEYDNPKYSLERQLRFLHMGAPWLSTLLVFCMLMPLNRGMTVIIEPLFAEKSFAEDLYKYKPNVTLSTISHWIYAVNSPKLKNIDLSGMSYPNTGGEKVTVSTEEKVNRFLWDHGCKSRLMTGYGMCELGSVATGNNLKEYREGSTGHPINGVIISAFDIDTNKEMKYHERGEIRVFTPARMKGYYKRPDATAEFFYKDAEGREWACTGDIGYLDEDGYVYVQGRKHDYFTNAKGQRVYCFDVEDLLLTDKAVDQCEVVGIDREEYQVAAAFVTQRAGTQVDIAKLVQLCKASLPAENVPVSIRVLDRFPIKPSGKRDMETLKKMAQAE